MTQALSGRDTIANAVGQRIRKCSTDTLYFSGTALANREGWYSSQLRAMGEQPLCHKDEAVDSARETYRLTWLPSFDHSVVVRIDRQGNAYRFEAKEESGAGGYEPGHLARDTAFALSAGDVEAFNQLLAGAAFWAIPTTPPPTHTIGFNGARWIMEGQRGLRYHVVDRWSPDRFGPDARYRRLAEWLLARSGLIPDTLVNEY